MDGSQKLPQRLLGTLKDNIEAGRESPALYLAVAAWMSYVSGTDENGQQIDVRDPLATRLRALSESFETHTDRVAALLNINEIFSAYLAERLQEPLSVSAERLSALGARGAVEELLL